MANRAITELPQGGDIQGADLFIMDRNGTAMSINGLALQSFLQARYEIVATRPSAGFPNVIYLVGSASPYEKWIYTDTWHSLGTEEVDLAGVVKYDTSQRLSSADKEMARTNIFAMEDLTSAQYTNLESLLGIGALTMGNPNGGE